MRVFLLCVYVLLLNLNFCQTDFSFQLNGAGSHSFDVDSSGNIYVFYMRLYEGLYLSKIDTLGNVLTCTQITTSQYDSEPYIKLNKNTALLAWRHVPWFNNSYIMGTVYKLQTDSLEFLPVILNDEYFDSDRFSPCIESVDSTFIIVWTGDGSASPTGSKSIYGKIIDTNFTPIAGDLLLSDHKDEFIEFGSSKVLYSQTSNKIGVLWIDESTGKKNIFIRFFTISGKPVSESVPVSEESGLDEIYYYDAAIRSDGSIGIVWGGKNNNGWQLLFNFFDPNGEKMIDDIIISDDVAVNVTPSIAFNKNDNFIIAYDKKVGDYYKIFAQRFNKTLEKFESEFQVSDENPVTSTWPRVKFNRDKFICTWAEDYNKINGIKVDFNNPYLGIRVEESIEELFNYIIGQNYPNPFNPVTTIEYSIPESKFITIKVCNSIGQEVATVENDYKRAGTHSVKFDGSNLASGLYIYTITTNGFTQSKKMLLIK